MERHRLHICVIDAEHFEHAANVDGIYHLARFTRIVVAAASPTARAKRV